MTATPALVRGKVVVAYREVHRLFRVIDLAPTLLGVSGIQPRRYLVAVIDLEMRAYDTDYPAVELSAEISAIDGSGVVKFDPKTAWSKAALAHARTDDMKMGYVYVSFGGVQDTQPWHGWVFEIDLDAWKVTGPEAAVSAVLLTTPETACGEPGSTGRRGMICGAGVWAPAGPQVYPTVSGFELLVPTGNGQLDLNRRDYANTLMRLGPGLQFDPGCDAQLCADFDPIRPAPGCMSSCRNLFIPRLMPADAPLRPASGVCDEKNFVECFVGLGEFHV